MDAFLQYLPPGPGLLPKWQLIVAVTAIGNVIQTYTTTNVSKRIYSNQTNQVTPLAARCFGTWSFVSAMVRFYAAYNMSNPQLYNVCMWTYIAGIFHFTSEWVYFRTANMGAGLISPMIVASLSLTWMIMERDFYVATSSFAFW